MDCNVIRDLLPLYQDEAVSEETKKVIEEHLESCEDCRRFYDEMRHIPHSLEDADGKGKYRYSEVVDMLKKRSVLEYSIGAALLVTSVAGIVKAVLGTDKRWR